MRKILTVVLIVLNVATLLSTNNVVVASDSIDVSRKAAYLIDNGIPEQYVERYSDQRISELFDQLVGKEFYFSTSTNIDTVLESPMSVVSSIPNNKFSYTMSFITEISRETGTNKAIIENIFTDVYYEWYSSPYARKEDAITINWDSDIFYYKANSLYADTYQAYYSGEWEFAETITSPTILSDGGLGLTIDLAPCYFMWEQDLVPVYYKGEISFTLRPVNNPTYSENNLSPSYSVTSVYATYLHDCSTSSVSSFSLDVTEDFNIGYVVDVANGVRQRATSVNIKYSTP